MQLIRNRLRVCDASRTKAFYTDLLGMSAIGTGPNPCFGYSQSQCLLEFREGDFSPYAPQPQDLYWKIGITVRNLDMAFSYLMSAGWPVSEPRQFQEIGYLCHLKDPEGFSIELLQQGFEGNDQPAGSGHPIGGQATLAHLTLRVSDLSQAKAFFGGTLGMRLMSVQPVRERGFCLYFYSWSDEPLPNPDLEAVENREWLWARPYTLIELQHLESEPAIGNTLSDAAGFAGFSYGDNAREQEVLSAQLVF